MSEERGIEQHGDHTVIKKCRVKVNGESIVTSKSEGNLKKITSIYWDENTNELVFIVED